MGTEDRRNFKIKRPYFFVEKEPMKKLWKVMEESLSKLVISHMIDSSFFPQNNRKKSQSKVLTDNLLNKLNIAVCADEPTTLMRDNFNLNMMDYETEKAQLKEKKQ